MRIIATHEQTDFDGVASQLGAYLLYDSSLPILPRRVNRNVKAFLTIYGEELPFIDPRDIPDKPINSIILVDTQSLISVKGMTNTCEIHVIDHHAVRKDIPTNWSVTIDLTGAITTTFVESIQQRGVSLSIVQATLLLLGIYEDTGSLTYSRTTSRDVRAAAHLIEQGANLSIASDYLNHPLSISQQKIYAELRESIQSLDVHGHNVIIAIGDATNMDEELSAIAHKLRDYYDPDAIFLIVKIKGGLQFIARSTSDAIDVAIIAAQLGGGGHPRAAASLIKNQTPEEVNKKLIGLLHERIEPAITVRQIMSSTPHILEENVSAKDALAKMQRYGYEGYPVVKEGRIIGLLTRRAVDRAVSHRLNLPASSLMISGEVMIRPEASLDTLQKLMVETGWGQIPVVDDESGKIIGIVTRTDFLNVITKRNGEFVSRNLSGKLEAALPPIRLKLLQTISEFSPNEDTGLYIVGGFVRDLLLDIPSTDYDIVVEGDAIAYAKSLKNAFGGQITYHTRFGTAKWTITEIKLALLNKLNSEFQETDVNELPDSLDFISARREFYTHPTALPTVERGSIKLDLHRRDFTINTLALRLDSKHYGELHDYWGGLYDLEHKNIRILHSLSFVDDPTRILRAVRYEQRYGFTITERTEDLLIEAGSLLSRISGDRIRHEIERILDEKVSAEILNRLNDLEILKHIHPKFIINQKTISSINNCDALIPPSEWNIAENIQKETLVRLFKYVTIFSHLQIDAIKLISKRIKLQRSIYDVVEHTKKILIQVDQIPGWKPSQVVNYFTDLSPVALFMATQFSDKEEVNKVIHSFLDEWRYIKPSIIGDDLKNMGIPPGPVYKTILKDLRSGWLDGTITSLSEEDTRLQSILNQHGIKD